MATDDLTPQQVEAMGMTPRDLAVRNLLGQAMDYAADGGTVDSLMDDNVTRFWAVFIDALDAAGWEIGPNTERRQQEEQMRALTSSPGSSLDLGFGGRRPGL